MGELSCQGCREVAAEMALGVLEARNRAEVLTHLARCTGCQETVAAMAVTADKLLDLLPECDPPPGFGDRVFAMINKCSPRNGEPVKGSSRAVPVAALVLVGALMTGVGWFLGDVTDGAAPAVVAASQQRVRPMADMLVAPLLSDGREVGRTYMNPRNPSWLFVSVFDDGALGGRPYPVGANSTVNCELVRLDGSKIVLGSFPIRDGHAVWVTDTSVDPGSVEGTRLTTSGGDTIASGNFPHRVPGTKPAGSSGVADQKQDKLTPEKPDEKKDKKGKGDHGKSHEKSHDKNGLDRGKSKPAHGDKNRSTSGRA